LAVLEAPLKMETVLPSPVPITSVEIRDVTSRELVTAIEILSTNKRGGLEEYLTKRHKLLVSNTILWRSIGCVWGIGFPCAIRFPTIRTL
jgi:hypothetical protein